MSQAMNIGEAAEAAGVSAKMIRHYEQIGLVPAAARTESGYHQYTDQDVSVLHFVRKSRQLGFSMDQIAKLLGLWSDRRCASWKVKALAQSHWRALEEKLREIAAMRKALKRLVVSCHGNVARPNAIALAALSRVRSQALKSHRVLSPHRACGCEAGSPPSYDACGSSLKPAVAATSGDSASTPRYPLASTWTAGPMSSSPRATKPGA